jgi:hypothetical protein
MASFNALEARIRDMTIDVTEVWSLNGQEVVGFRAVATDGEGKTVAVERPGRLTAAVDVGELLAALARAVAAAAD